MPKILLHLISLILEGTLEYDKVSDKSKRLALNIAQVIRFNAVKTKRSSHDSNFRHSATNEPPLLSKIGLLIHSKTRKISVVDDLAKEGLSIGYKRVLEIEETIAQKICEKI